MADVLQKVNNSNEYINGAAVVRSDKLGNIAKSGQTINDNTRMGSISRL